MASWLSLPFEIKSQILDIYLWNLPYYRDLLHWTCKAHDSHECSRQIVQQAYNVLLVTPSMQTEYLRLATIVRDKHVGAYENSDSELKRLRHSGSQAECPACELVARIWDYECLLTSLHAPVHELEVGEQLPTNSHH